jgi:hypothetical protein
MNKEEEVSRLMEKTQDELMQGAIKMALEINQKTGRIMTEAEFKKLLSTVFATFAQVNADKAGIPYKDITTGSPAEIDEAMSDYLSEFKRLNPSQAVFK